jgi:hypothetical protein
MKTPLLLEENTERIGVFEKAVQNKEPLPFKNLR